MGRGHRPRLQRRPSWPYAFHVKLHPVKSTLRAEVEGLSIGIAPGKVMRMFRRNNCAEMLALRRENPQTTGTGNVKIASFIDLHAIDCVLPQGLGHIEKEFPVPNRTVGLHFITHHYLLLFVPVADVQVFFVRRECDSVRPSKILCNEFQISVLHCEHAAERQFLARIVEEFWQTEWWIGEISYAVFCLKKKKIKNTY